MLKIIRICKHFCLVTFVSVQSIFVFIAIMKAARCVLDHLHGIENLKIFTNGKMTPKVITTTYV